MINQFKKLDITRLAKFFDTSAVSPGQTFVDNKDEH